MTIFHILKYQLSDPPTAEELEALPIEVYQALMTKFMNMHGLNFNTVAYRIGLRKRLNQPEYERIITYIRDELAYL